MPSWNETNEERTKRLRSERRWLIGATIVVIGGYFAISVAMQAACVNIYAPWLLGTDDKQAIAFYCKPDSSK